jgi:hypothetical protein
MRRVLYIGGGLVIGSIIVLLCLPYGSKLSGQLEQEVSQRFAAGTPQNDVEGWLKSKGASYSVFKKSAAHGAIERAGLKADAVDHFILSLFNEERFPFPFAIQIYFFFDENNQLVGHWIFTREIAP